MKIFVYSSTYLPNVGGLENIMAGLVTEWSNLGHKVTVATKALKKDHVEHNMNYAIVRNPGLLSFFQLAKKSDILLEANLSLKTIIVGLLLKKKWVVIHHLPYSHQNTLTGKIKNIITFFSRNISVSNYVANTLLGKSAVINNFYNPVYLNLSITRRPFSLLFVGRLVNDKGVLLLLKAFLKLKKEFANISLVIVGEGDEKDRLIEFVSDNDLKDHVSFYGSKYPEELCHIYNQAKAVVIPSIWDEPFGIVALEGMACGCLIACSNKPGLRESTGGLAFEFDPKNPESICSALKNALAFYPSHEYEKAVSDHLEKHERKLVAQQYIELFENSCL
jgi:glycogen synthase